MLTRTVPSLNPVTERGPSATSPTIWTELHITESLDDSLDATLHKYSARRQDRIVAFGPHTAIVTLSNAWVDFRYQTATGNYYLRLEHEAARVSV